MRNKSFNSATTVRSWKTSVLFSTSMPLAVLQFGHDGEVVENAKVSMAWTWGGPNPK